ncbi:C3H1 type-like 2-A) [Durusdinium trenchii]|uniref:C3H1 type-like 2-A n=1 Tax=Durusdinium trenchii TaxID=1381693 RepID=A0ABP0R7Y2_9DINO
MSSDGDKETKRLAAHKKTQLCRFFEVGACTRGEGCSFAHGMDQLRQQPDFSKTRLCAGFLELGRCALGRKCKFAHGKRELRPGSAAKIGRPGKAEQEGLEMSSAEQTQKTFCLQQTLHEQAALQLLLRKAEVTPGVCVGLSKVEEDKAADGEDFEGADSLSRQVTWEGVESTSAGFIRDVSISSTGSERPLDTFSPPTAAKIPYPELPKLYDELEMLVRNTFVELRFKDGEHCKGLRTSRSLPVLGRRKSALLMN